MATARTTATPTLASMLGSAGTLAAVARLAESQDANREIVNRKLVFVHEAVGLEHLAGQVGVAVFEGPHGGADHLFAAAAHGEEPVLRLLSAQHPQRLGDAGQKRLAHPLAAPSPGASSSASGASPGTRRRSSIRSS